MLTIKDSALHVGAWGLSPILIGNSRKVFIMALDPEEFVILEDHGPMTLCSAVARAMVLPPDQRCHASILRQGQPWLLNFDEIKHIARRWDGGPYPLEDSEMAAGAFRLRHAS